MKNFLWKLQQPQQRQQVKHNSEKAKKVSKITDFLGIELNPFAKKLAKGVESCLILACTAEFAPHPMMIFVRLHRPQIFRSHCEVPTPTRFLCIIVGPLGSETRVMDIGKALGTLMSDQVSKNVSFRVFSAYPWGLYYHPRFAREVNVSDIFFNFRFFPWLLTKLLAQFKLSTPLKLTQKK